MDEMREDSGEMTYQMPQVAQDAMERLARAGWVSQCARSHEGLALQWTEKGARMSAILQAIVEDLGGAAVTGPEISAILALLDVMGPPAPGAACD